MTRGINLLVRFNGTRIVFFGVCALLVLKLGWKIPQWSVFQDHPTNRKSPMAMDFMAYPKHEV